MMRNVPQNYVTRHPHGVRHGVRARLSADLAGLEATTYNVVAGV